MTLLLSFCVLALLPASLALPHASSHPRHHQLRRTMLARSAPAGVCAPVAPLLPQDRLDKVIQNLALNSEDSWVAGTATQALLELRHANMTVFSPTWYPTSLAGLMTAPEVDSIAKGWMDKLPEEAQSLAVEGAAGDTASLGVSFVNAYLSQVTDPATRNRFARYAQREIDWVLGTLPRLENGAISHRPVDEAASAWDDFVYMVPPFLAYWGVMNQNEAIVRESFQQIRLYREYLQDPATLLWHHVKGGDPHDEHWSYFWGTGMAWAAAGITRVLATLEHSTYYGMLAPEIAELAGWANDIISATFAELSPETGLLPNTYDEGIETFDDAASSALLSATAYRLATLGVLESESERIQQAEKIRQAVYGKLSAETSWLTGVADPLNWQQQTDQSPESMAFVMLLEAAVRDYENPCKAS